MPLEEAFSGHDLTPPWLLPEMRETLLAALQERLLDSFCRKFNGTARVAISRMHFRRLSGV